MKKFIIQSITVLFFLEGCAIASQINEIEENIRENPEINYLDFCPNCLTKPIFKDNTNNFSDEVMNYLTNYEENSINILSRYLSGDELNVEQQRNS